MPADAQSDQSPISRVADEFLAAYRNGEQPDITAFTAAHPDMADEIRDLFPVLLSLERVDTRRPAPVTGYRVVRRIGAGGMGEVYEAVQEALGRRVALKLMKPRGRVTEAFRERFRREARAAGRLHHTNVVPVFDSGEAGGVLYYAMQYIPGRGLDAVIADPAPPTVPPAQPAPTASLAALGSTVSFAAAPRGRPQRRGATRRTTARSRGTWRPRRTAWTTPTGTASCTATSSRRTCCWTTTRRCG